MFCQCNASTIYTVFYNYVTHIKQVVKQPIDTSLWTKLQAKKHRASTIFKRDMLAQSLGEYTVKNCLSTLCIHFIPWIQPQLTVHHFLSVGSNYMETPIVFPPYKYAENHRFFLFHTWSSHPRRPGQAVLHPTTPALHRAQLFTFAQGRGYKKATLPWGGLDGAQIPVVKNKTLRKAGPGAVYGLGDERHGRTGELRWENPALLCGPLWFCTSLMLGTGQKEGVRDVQCKSPCQGNRNKTDVWCRPRRRVLPWTHDQVLQVQPWGSPGCSLGRRNSFWIESSLYVCIEKWFWLGIRISSTKFSTWSISFEFPLFRRKINIFSFSPEETYA